MLAIGVDCWALRLNGGGARFVFESLLEVLADTHHRFILFLHPEAYACVESVQRRTGILRNAIRIKIGDPSEIYRYEKYIDLLYCPFNNISVRFFGKPVVSVLHDIQEQFLPHLFSQDEVAARKEIYGDILRASDVTITISQFCRNSFVDKYQADPARIEVVPNAPQQALLRWADANANLSCVPLDGGLKGKSFMLYPANFYPHKNHSRLLAAYRKAKKEAPKLPALVLLGAQWSGAKVVDQQLLEDGIGDHVKILIDVSPDKLAKLYRGCEFVVLPTLFEGFCLPAVEALAFGKHVICSDLPILREVTSGHADYFNPHDTEAIAGALVAASANGASDNAKIRGRRRAAAKYSWRRSAAKTLSICERTFNTYYARGQKLDATFAITIVYHGEPADWLIETLSSVNNANCPMSACLVCFSPLPTEQGVEKQLSVGEITVLDGANTRPSDVERRQRKADFSLLLFAGNVLTDTLFLNVAKEAEQFPNAEALIGEVRQVHEDVDRTFERDNYFRIIDGDLVLDGHLYPEMVVFAGGSSGCVGEGWAAFWNFWEKLPGMVQQGRARVVRRTFAQVRYRTHLHHRMEKRIVPAARFEPAPRAVKDSADRAFLEAQQEVLAVVNASIASKIGCSMPPTVTELARMGVKV